MGKASDLIRVAKSYEGSNYKHFCNEFGGGCWAWCAAFVSTVAKESGNAEIIPRSTSCNDQIVWFKERGCWLGKVQNIRVGDILYYDWDKLGDSRPADHVGIVVEVSGGIIRVIEGNKGDAANDKTTVGVRTIPTSYAHIFGVARPRYEVETVTKKEIKKVSVEVPQLEIGTSGKSVESMQAVLISKGYSCGRSGTDGDFGSDTKKAVENYQKDKKLDVDGICGKDTWTSLLNS